ncbi:MAG: MBL fold metallo-hydrolase [Lachnospiraceae bacterium]
MNVFYIFHSSFLVEATDCYYLFDYYKGELPPLNRQKPILVFASHRHPDHYNRRIFTLLKEYGMKDITAILSKDIPKEDYPEDISVTTVTFHKEYSLPHHSSLKTLLSTDEGVAFLVTCSDGKIYHAGDLNDWVWEGESEQYNKQMTGSYRHEIDLIKGEHIDLSFLPLDPRQEKNYSRGILYFLKQVKTKTVFPMHYWEQPQVIKQFITEYPEYQEMIADTEEYGSR